MTTLDRLLIVEDNPRLRATLELALAGFARERRACADVADARVALAEFRPDLLLVDFELPDGTALDLLAAAAALALSPPVVAISGKVGPEAAFALGQHGVRAFVAKPLELDGLEATLAAAVARPAPLAPVVRALVGQRSAIDVEEEVRATMLGTALARAEGSRRGAAKLLRISRQLLQHRLRSRRVPLPSP